MRIHRHDVRQRNAIQTDISVAVREYIQEVGQYLQNVQHIAEPLQMKIPGMNLRPTRRGSVVFQFFGWSWILMRWVWIFGWHVVNNNDQARQSASQ